MTPNHSPIGQILADRSKLLMDRLLLELYYNIQRLVLRLDSLGLAYFCTFLSPDSPLRYLSYPRLSPHTSSPCRPSQTSASSDVVYDVTGNFCLWLSDDGLFGHIKAHHLVVCLGLVSASIKGRERRSTAIASEGPLCSDLSCSGQVSRGSPSRNEVPDMQVVLRVNRDVCEPKCGFPCSDRQTGNAFRL